MPKLEEGNLWIRATLPTSVSLEQSAKYVGRMRAILRGCPETGRCSEDNRRHREVLTVISQLGRPDDGTDVAGFQNIELFAPLRPFGEWKKGVTKESLTDELSKELGEAFPGVVFNFSQMISDNVEEAMSGVKGENSIKVFGPDVVANEKIAEQAMAVLGERAGRARPRPRPLERAAEHQDRPRSPGLLALRPQHRQRRGGHPGGDRRQGGDPGLRGRSSLRSHGALARRRIANRSRPSRS